MPSTPTVPALAPAEQTACYSPWLKVRVLIRAALTTPWPPETWPEVRARLPVAAHGGAAVTGDRSWSYREAYSTASQCTAELKASAKRFADALGGEITGNFVSVTTDGTPIVIQYHCVPDTVDPRGPKGK